jgi:predicted metal-dependent hydrolase
MHPRARKFKFPPVRDYWFAGDPFRSRFFDAWSTMFPIAERFFVESVLNFKDAVDDPAMQDQIRVFTQQEGNHAREHHRYNERLRELGYDLDAMDRSQQTNMGQILKMKPIVPLAVTVSIEHMTAVLGAAVLRGEVFKDADLATSDRQMVTFWSWHSAEEVEHRAVPFDVFTRVGGTARMRRLAMVRTIAVVSARLTSRMMHMLRKDGQLWNPRVWVSGARFLVGRGGFLRVTARDFFAYFRDDFHPDQMDDQGLVAEWDGAQAASG